MPLLINMSSTDITQSPMNTLEVTRFEKEDFYQLVETINRRTRAPVTAEILRDEFEEKWPKLERAVEKAISEAVEHEPNNASPESRPVEAVLEDVVTTMRDLSLEVKGMKTGSSVAIAGSSVALSAARQMSVRNEVAKIISEEANAVVYDVDILEGKGGSIYLNLWTSPSADENELDRITQILESRPKFRVVWSKKPFHQDAQAFIDNTAITASEGPQRDEFKHWPRPSEDPS
jgi:hypothetical protein